MKNKFGQKIIDFETDINFRPRWYTIFLNPYFIARSRLYQAVAQFAKQSNQDAVLLDVGCGMKPYRHLFPAEKYLGIDIEGGGHSSSQKTVDKFFDGEHIPYRENEFDIVISTQVFEHALNLNGLMKEISRVLKSDGILFVTAPLVWHEHEIPYDFRRFTKFGLQELLTEHNFKVITIRPTTGIFATCGQLFSAFLSESFARLVDILPVKFRLKYPLNKLFILLICFPVQVISLILDLIFFKRGITLDYVAIAQKKS